MKQGKKLVLFFLVAVMVGQSAARADEQAAQILSGIRLADISQELEGRLRKQDGTIIPFRLRANGDELIFTFANPTEVLRLTLNDNGSNLPPHSAPPQPVITPPTPNATFPASYIPSQHLAFRFF